MGNKAGQPSVEISGAQFVNVHAASADINAPGSIVLPIFEREISDHVKERGTLGQRIQAEEATGHPTRYFEETALAEGAFVDPRNLSATPTNPTRVERGAMLKAITNQINYGLFDVEVARSQGQFTNLQAKDLNKTIAGVLRISDKKLWNGSDTNLMVPTTLEYVGLLTQINRTASLDVAADPTLSIVDALKAEVAALADLADFEVNPSAIYLNAELGDRIDREEKAAHRTMDKVEVTAGVKVNAISTQKGLIPLIVDSFLPVTTLATPSRKVFKAVIVSESLLERRWIGSPTPRVFQLGLVGDLASKYVVVQFDNVIAKGRDGSSNTFAHTVMTVTVLA